MPAPIEHFSPTLHFDGPGRWMWYVKAGLLAASVVGGLCAGVRTLWPWQRWWQRLAAAVAAAALLYSAASLIPHLQRYQGKLQSLVVEDTPRARVFRATFAWSGKSSGVIQRVYSAEGALLGERSRSGSHWYKVEGEVGGALLIRDDEDLLLIDRHTLEDIADIGDALDDAYGEGQYQVRGVSAQGVEVLRKHGQVETFDALARLPEGLRDAQTREVWSPSHPDRCATDALDYRDDHKATLHDLAEASGLLRPQVVHAPTTSSNALPCQFEVRGQPAALVLHRSTALGDDGGFALSALASGSPQPPLWTTDLGPAVGPYEVTSLQLLDVRQPKPDALCFWMTRNKRSLSEVCLSAATGALLRAQVIF